jgi:hypothetical protein
VHRCWLAALAVTRATSGCLAGAWAVATLGLAGMIVVPEGAGCAAARRLAWVARSFPAARRQPCSVRADVDAGDRDGQSDEQSAGDSAGSVDQEELTGADVEPVAEHLLGGERGHREGSRGLAAGTRRFPGEQPGRGGAISRGAQVP